MLEKDPVWDFSERTAAKKKRAGGHCPGQGDRQGGMAVKMPERRDRLPVKMPEGRDRLLPGDQCDLGAHGDTRTFMNRVL